MTDHFLDSCARLGLILLTVALLGAAPGCRFSSNSADTARTNSNVSTSVPNAAARKSGLFKKETRSSSRQSSAEKSFHNGAGEVNSDSPGQALPISWRFSPGQYRDRNGQRYTFQCLPNGEPASVLGTDIYTDDSSICTAAIHEGLISIASGGVVTIEIRPGQDAYIGSERNGIKSLDFKGRWSGSFVFVRSSGGS